jgi:hypothetical protein
MASTEAFVDVQEAARLLGVTVQHVRRLADRGDIVFVARGLVDLASIREYLAVRQASRTRAWSEETAWAAVALLSGLEVDWLGEAQKSRLRGRLRETTATELASQSRNRARVHRYVGHPAAADRIAKDIVVIPRETLGLVTIRTGTTVIDGYTSPEAEEQLVQRYALARNPAGRFVLRATDFDLGTIDRLGKTAEVLASLDASTSTDPRARAVGEAILERRLAKFRSAERVSDSRQQAAERAERAVEQARKRLGEAARQKQVRVKAAQRVADRKADAAMRHGKWDGAGRVDEVKSGPQLGTAERELALARKRLEEETERAEKRLSEARVRLAAAEKKAHEAARRAGSSGPKGEDHA